MWLGFARVTFFCIYSSLGRFTQKRKLRIIIAGFAGPLPASCNTNSVEAS